MQTQINSVTGNSIVNFTAKVISIAENPLQNVNGKDFYPCTIEFEDVNGKTQRSSAIIYGANYAYGIKAGDFKLATAEKTEKGVLIKVSHLDSGKAPRPTEDMFGFGQTKLAANQKEAATA